MINNKIMRINFAKTVLQKKLSVEEVALLNRNTKNLSDLDVMLLVPLSRYNHWFKMACETAHEIVRMSRGVNEEMEPVMQSLVENYISARCDTMEMYYTRALSFHREYKEILRKHQASKTSGILPVIEEFAKTA